MSDAGATRSERVIEVIVALLGVDPEFVVPKARLIEDLGTDSLDFVEITLAIEEEFAICISDETYKAWKTVADVMATVNEATHLVRRHDE